jgi:quercetin dioxygenase-like cupin family protein
MQKSMFPEPESMGIREWGTEELLVLVTGAYTLKRITLNAGSKGGLQYHRRKNECGILIEGRIIVRYADEDNKLVEKIILPGGVFHFEPGVVHQTEAIETSVYIEASTPHFNDRVHVESKFGLPEEVGGLPTTSVDEIEER